MLRVIISVLVIIGLAQINPLNAQSPCPEIFEYKNDDNGVYGVITLKPNGYKPTITIRTNFTITAKLNSDYVGNIKPYGGAEAIREYNNGNTIRYRVNLPISSPLPKITAIYVNENLVCADSPDTLETSNYVTSISLQHMLYMNAGPTVIRYTGNTPVKHTNVINYVTNNNDGVYKFPSSLFNDQTTYKTTYYYTDKNKPVNEVFNKPDSYIPEIIKITGGWQELKPGRWPTEWISSSNMYKPPQEITTTTTTTAPTIAQPPPSPTPQNVFTNKSPPRIDDRYSEPFANTQCGVSKNAIGLIWHGQSYERGEWPWLVAIYQNVAHSLTFVCSGTLVSDRHVLTAAHCMQNKKASDMVVKVGVYNLDEWGGDIETRNLESAYVHENFTRSNFANDISLFTLERSVQFNSNIKPVCLWGRNADINKIVGHTGVVTGWGDNESGKGGHGNPRLIRLPIVSTKQCRASKSDFHKLTSDYTLCAGNRDGSGPCSGDSGGGLFVLDDGRWKVRGIVSVALSATSADKRCNLDEYVVFTDVAKYSDWIRKYMSF